MIPEDNPRGECGPPSRCPDVPAPRRLGPRADEPRELWEELISANAPGQMRLVDRFPSSEACQSRALQLSETAAPPPERRLGYTCLPATPLAATAS